MGWYWQKSSLPDPAASPGHRYCEMLVPVDPFRTWSISFYTSIGPTYRRVTFKKELFIRHDGSQWWLWVEI